jgi:hypothetical protein
LIFRLALLHEGEDGRRPDEGAAEHIKSNFFPLTLTLSLRERKYLKKLSLCSSVSSVVNSFLYLLNL